MFSTLCLKIKKTSYSISIITLLAFKVLLRPSSGEREIRVLDGLCMIDTARKSGDEIDLHVQIDSGHILRNLRGTARTFQ